MKKPTITICSSVAFYRQAVDIRNVLVQHGYTVLLPDIALKMEETGDFEVSHYKEWWEDANAYTKKANLMKGHFNKVAKGDVTLVLNYEKHGQPNYIGGNVLMEMGLAQHLGKPIYILNGLPEGSSFEEEILGVLPVFLNGNLDLLHDHLGEAVPV